MNLTKKWLQKEDACKDGFEWWVKSKCETVESTIEKLLADTEEKEALNWANWLIVRAISNDNKIRYAIFAARLVLELYEKEYPNDARPRKAIEAAENYLKIKTTAAWAAARAAWAAARAAGDAAGAAWAAAWAAGDAAWAAAYKKMVTEIIKYGLELLNIKQGKKVK